MQETIQGKNGSVARRKRAEILDLLKEFEQAENLSIPAFCRSHNINPTTFYYWRKQYGGTVTRRPGPNGFISLPFSRPSQVLGNNPSLFAEVHGIRLYKAVPAEYLKALLP